MLTVKEMEAIGSAIGEMVADMVAKVEADMVSRQAAYEARISDSIEVLRSAVDALPKSVLDSLPESRDGKDATDEQVEKAVFAYFDANPVREPEDGKSVTVEDVMPEIMEHVQKALDAIPVPRDGKDADPVTDEQVSKAVSEYLTDNPPPAGESVTVEQVMPELRAELQKALESIPTVDDVLPQLMELVQKAVDEFPLPKDGESVTVEDVKPLLQAMQAEWALDFERRAHETVQRAIDRMPLPKDGKDALSLKDFEIALSDDCRTMTVSLTDGENTVERSIHFPALVYQGVWKQGDEAKPGDVKTYDGSMWVCLKETKGKPGEYSGDWRLAVKRGRNGKSEK